jgi:hypothetical protein
VGKCALCGDVEHETAQSVALDAEVCLRCYSAAPRPAPRDHLHGCPSCGDPQGARYGAERVCWPCYGERHRGAVRTPRRRRKPSPFETLFNDVWSWMEADGHASTTGDGPVVIVGYCPRCHETMCARLLDEPVEVMFECRGSCTPAQIAAQLGRGRARAA